MEEPSEPPPAVVERWEPVDDSSSGLCLIFQGSESLTMALIGREHPAKIEITADYERTVTALHVVPARILRHRFISSCRDTVLREAELDAQEVLGLQLVPGERATFALRQVSEDRLEVCGLPEQCILLGRAAPTPEAAP